MSVKREVLECLRRTALAGSDRAVPLDEPLGEEGLGLDSMSQVEFLTELECRFEVEIFESEWFGTSEPTLRSLIGWLEGGEPVESLPERAAASGDSLIARAFRRVRGR